MSVFDDKFDIVREQLTISPNDLRNQYIIRDHGSRTGDDWNMCFYLCATEGNIDDAMRLKNLLAHNAYKLDDEKSNWDARGKMVDIDVIFPLVELYQCIVKIYNFDGKTLLTISPKNITENKGLIMMLFQRHYYRMTPK